MNLVSAEGYKNAGVQFLKIKKTGEIWVSMKDSRNGLGVRNIFDLVSKKYIAFVGKKIQLKKKLNNIK